MLLHTDVAPAKGVGGKLFTPRPLVESDTFVRLMQLKFMQTQASVEVWEEGMESNGVGIAIEQLQVQLGACVM